MILLVAAEKGGVGKSTVAINLAVAMISQGLDVCLVDTDPQGSATSWSRARQDQGHEPYITTVNMSGRIGRDLIGLSKKYSALIIDAGGRDSLEIREAAAICDLWLLPTLPGQLDTWSLDSALNLCKMIERQSGTKPETAVLINRVNVLPNIQDSNELADALGQDEEMRHYLPLCPVRLCDRLDYSRAPRSGQGVTEYAPNSKAAEEVQKLLQFVAGDDEAQS